MLAASLPCWTISAKAVTLRWDGSVAVAGAGLGGRGLSAVCRFRQIIVEPVHEWQTLCEGEGNILDRMYQDPKRWGFMFQSYVLLTMMEAHATPQTHPIRWVLPVLSVAVRWQR